MEILFWLDKNCYYHRRKICYTSTKEKGKKGTYIWKERKGKKEKLLEDTY